MTPAQHGWAALLTMAGLAASAQAETDFTRLTPQERRIFHNEIRAVLLTVPQLLPLAPPPPADPYAGAIASDLARIKAHADALFAPALPGFGPADAKRTIALFTTPDCPDCTLAEADLRDLATRHDLRVTLLDMKENSDLAKALDLDLAPSYVFPDKMLRGHMPAIVLDRYLSE